VDAHLFEDRTLVYDAWMACLRERSGRVSLQTGNKVKENKTKINYEKNKNKNKLTQSQSGLQYLYSSNLNWDDA
jgi:DNA-binding LacI/PurR family transcriptional regulator